MSFRKTNYLKTFERELRIAIHLHTISHVAWAPTWWKPNLHKFMTSAENRELKYFHVHVCDDNAELHKLFMTIQVTEVDRSWCPVTPIRDDTFAFDECINREKGVKTGYKVKEGKG